MPLGKVLITCLDFGEVLLSYWSSYCEASAIFIALLIINSIPAEVIKSQRLQSTLCALFNRCFIKGVIPSAWKKGVIQSIPKSSTADKRDPLSYRGLTVTSSFYKLYCVILNNRLIKWEEEFSILNDAQNGFRSGRSTVDHISSLSSIIETRKLKKQSTYVGFIDFKKAYDSIDRNIMFKKLTVDIYLNPFYPCTIMLSAVLM